MKLEQRGEIECHMIILIIWGTRINEIFFHVLLLVGPWVMIDDRIWRKAWSWIVTLLGWMGKYLNKDTKRSGDHRNTLNWNNCVLWTWFLQSLGLLVCIYKFDNFILWPSCVILFLSESSSVQRICTGMPMILFQCKPYICGFAYLDMNSFPEQWIGYQTQITNICWVLLHNRFHMLVILEYYFVYLCLRTCEWCFICKNIAILLINF